uniref:Golgin-84 n=1 Tax=Gongylonema pulchrum TaxID=637853 RepID=A0A183EJF0_9BILA
LAASATFCYTENKDLVYGGIFIRCQGVFWIIRFCDSFVVPSNYSIFFFSNYSIFLFKELFETGSDRSQLRSNVMDNEIETLKTKLEKAESEKLAVAQLARDILLKDEEKDQRLATLGEENLQQSRDIARLQALLTSRDEYLAEMENEIAKLQNEVATLNDKKSSYLVELEQKISSLHAQVTEKNAILSDTGQKVLQLKKNLAAKERELEEALKKTPEKFSVTETPNSDREKNMFSIKLVCFSFFVKKPRIVTRILFFFLLSLSLSVFFCSPVWVGICGFL